MGLYSRPMDTNHKALRKTVTSCITMRVLEVGMTAAATMAKQLLGLTCDLELDWVEQDHLIFCAKKSFPTEAVALALKHKFAASGTMTHDEFKTVLEIMVVEGFKDPGTFVYLVNDIC